MHACKFWLNSFKMCLAARQNNMGQVDNPTWIGCERLKQQFFMDSMLKVKTLNTVQQIAVMRYETQIFIILISRQNTEKQHRT